MPLFVRGGDDDDGSDWSAASAKTRGELLECVYENYRVSSARFLEKPSQLIAAENGLYVSQRECAVVPRANVEDGIAIVGSDNATTCHIVILYHEASGTSAVSHFDGVDSVDQLKTFLKAVLLVLEDIGARKSWDTTPLSFATYIIGGFDDDRSVSRKLSEEVLWLLHTQPSSITPTAIDPINFHLHVACISKLNTTIGPPGPQFGKPWPAVFGAAIDVNMGDVFPCEFQNRGPEESLRSARHFSDERDLLNVYCHRTKRVIINPFPYYPIRGAELILESSDEWILQNMSTSPNVEPPHFPASVRREIRFLLDNPDWRLIFANGPIQYEKLNGRDWTKVTEK